MKRTILVALSSVVLTSCAEWHGGRGPSWIAPDPHHPRVWVIPAGAHEKPVVVVDQEPIYIVQRASNTIVWSLDPKGGYHFPADQQRRAGIEFTGAEGRELNARCRRGETRYQYVCTYTKTPDAKPPKKYLYKITVTANDKDFIESDPTMMN